MTLDWQLWHTDGRKATLINGDIVIVTGWVTGEITLTHLCATYRFTRRADAYMAAELLNTALYLATLP